jgi:hypothetical protein
MEARKSDDSSLKHCRVPYSELELLVQNDMITKGIKFFSMDITEEDIKNYWKDLLPNEN